MNRLVHRAAALTALATLLATVVLAPGASAAPSGTVGVYPGFNDIQNFRDFEQDLGRPLSVIVQYLGRKSPSDMTSSSYGILRPGGPISELAGSVQLSLTVPLGFGMANARDDDGKRQVAQNLAATAAGEHDGAYRTVAQRLVQSGHGDAIIRLGHEFDGGWAPYASDGNEEVYKRAFRHVATLLRRESPGIRIDWNGVRARFERFAPQAYPGDEYVDIIGLDYYNRGGETWEGAVERAFQFHLDFAKQHGKPVSYPEWGLRGADRYDFVEDMHAWMSSLPARGAGALAYHSYFDVKDYALDHYPKASATFQRLFG